MKKALLLLVFALRFFISPAQWQQIYSPTGNVVRSMSIPSSTVAFLVGHNVVKRTTDSGQTWISQNPQILSTFEAVQFLDVNTGFVVGSGGAFVRTTNSGDTWVPSVIFPFNLTSVFFLNASNGFVGTENGEILRTVDGGNTWEVLDTDTSSEIRSIIFIDETNAYALGENGSIIFSQDGGASWNLIGDAGNTTFSRMCKKLDGTFIAVGNHGSIYSKSSTTQNWVLENYLEYHHLVDVAFYSNQLGFAVGQEMWSNTAKVFTTQNGGDTWTLSSFDLQRFHSVAFSADGSLGFLAGSNNGFYRMISEPNAVEENESIDTSSAFNFSIFPNPSSGVLNLALPSTVTFFDGRIIDATGRVVWQKERCSDRSIAIDHLAAGKYVFQMTTQDQSSSLHFEVIN